MRKSTLMILAVFVALGCPHAGFAQEKIMPVTASSQQAVEYLRQAQAFLVDGEVVKGSTLLHKAITADPDFFMGNFQLALTYYLFGDETKFLSYCEQAFQGQTALSPGENILKSILSRLYKNPDADVTDLSSKLINMYPNDRSAYYLHATFQRVNGNYPGALQTYQKLLTIVNNPGPVYHFIGYTEMSLEQWAEAKKAFEQYILSEPDHPNPYDCMGDFYMAQNDYAQAYTYYMKAHTVDNNWGYDKAMKAKEKLEKTSATQSSVNDTIK